jgi:hypothetical protein
MEKAHFLSASRQCTMRNERGECCQAAAVLLYCNKVKNAGGDMPLLKRSGRRDSAPRCRRVAGFAAPED